MGSEIDEGTSGRPPVTVVLPVRNGAAFIETAISSVLGQTLRRFQLIVSDNGSTDDTLERVARHADARLTVIRQPRPLDMISHFNKCLDLVDTEYYMLLCHDDYLYAPEALQKACSVLHARPRVSAVYSDLAYVDKAERTILIRRFDAGGVVDADVVARNSVVLTRNLFGIPLLVRTRSLGSLRYDGSFPYSADVDLSIGIGRHSEIFRIREPLIANRYHGENASFGLFRETLRELKGIASKHDIALTSSERIRMHCNSWSIALQKWLFFQYLLRMRRYPQ